jgi:hypothetical protein
MGYRPTHFGKITYVDDIKFDSGEEARYYTEFIKPKLATKEISQLRIHPSYVLIKGFTNEVGKVYKDKIYSPDFVYYDESNKKWCFIDVKDRLDDEFIIKRMLFDQFWTGLGWHLEVLKYFTSEKRFVDIDDYAKLIQIKRKEKIRSKLIKEQEEEANKEQKRLGLIVKYEAEMNGLAKLPYTNARVKRIEWLSSKISSLRK